MKLDQRQTEMLKNLQYVDCSKLPGYKIDKLLFNVSRFAIESSWVQTIKDTFKRIVYNSFEMAFLDDESDLLLVSYDYKRLDHQKSWATIKEMFSNYNEIKIEAVGIRAHAFLRLKDVAQSMMIFYRIFKDISCIRKNRERLYLSGRLTELVRLKEMMDSYLIKCKVALIFFDGNSYENLIVQYLKNKGIKCVTMQHGQPVFRGKDIDRINQTMILNFSSDYVLVTGEFSKKQFMLGGIPDQAIKVVGSWRDVYKYEDKNSDLFTVFLDCPTYDSAFRDNCKMIEIAEMISVKLGKRYLIKLHPQDSAEKYSGLYLAHGVFMTKDKTLADSLSRAEFSILHASGVYLDSLSMGVKSFCLETDFGFPLVTNDEDKFSSLQELEEKLGIWMHKNADERQEYLNDVVDYYLSPQNSIERHKAFVYSLLSVQILSET